MQSYSDGMMRYFDIWGRSTRMQYWMFYTMMLLVTAGAFYLDYRMGAFRDPRHPKPFALIFVSLVHVVPAMTIQVRRLHDVGRSGLWFFVSLIPFGSLLLLYWACLPSQRGFNVHDGLNPNDDFRPQARVTTIPRQVRMGNGAARPQVLGKPGDAPSQRFI